MNLHLKKTLTRSISHFVIDNIAKHIHIRGVME